MNIPHPEIEYLIMYQLPDESEYYCPSQFLSYFEAREYIKKRMTHNKKFKAAKIKIVAITTTYEVM